MSKTLSKDEVIDIIVKDSKYTREQIEEQITQTVEMMDNMVNEEGAAYVVANNLGVIINLDQSTEPYKINQLVAGQSNVTVVAKVNRIYDIREFTRKDNSNGYVRNIEIIDSSGSARIALWDKKVNIIEEKQIELGSIIRISGANTKIGFHDNIELSIGSHGLIDKDISGINNEDFPEIKTADVIKLNELITTEGEVSVEGKIIDRQGIKEFNRSGKTGRVTSLMLKDLTGKAKVTFWNDSCDKSIVWDVGDIVQITDVRVGVNKFGDKELTFNPHSKIIKLEDPGDISGIEIPSQKILKTLDEIEDGLSSVIVIGKITDIGEIRTFEREGRSNQVANIVIQDKTRSLRVNLWGKQADIVSKIEIGTIIRIKDAQTKLSNFSGEIEISCGDRSKVEISPSNVDHTHFDFKGLPILISDINENRSGVSLKIQIISRFEQRDIEKKDGTSTSVLNMIISDFEGNQGRLAAWENNISKINDFEEGDGLEIISARVKPGSEEYAPEVIIQKTTIVNKIDQNEITPLIQSADKIHQGLHYQKVNLNQLSEGSKVHVRGTIVKAYKPVIYNGCSQCARKVIIEEGFEEKGNCKVHGEVNSQPRLILTIVLEDTHDSCTIKLFGKIAESLLNMTVQEVKDLIDRLSDENAPINKSKIELKEIWVEGKVVKDDIKELLQINADTVGSLDIVKEADAILDKHDKS